MNYNESLLHYVWKHRLLPASGLTTTDGQQMEIIDPGLHNRRNSGPDFFNAKVKIDGMLWVGNIEIHKKASDWFAHGHQLDPAYDNTVLHVCAVVDAEAVTSSGKTLPQLQIDVPADVLKGYEQLLREDRYPPCYLIIPELSPLKLHSWMSALQTERLEQKTEAIRRRAEQADGSWEQAFFVTLARNFGFGINGDAFETWAQAVPLDACAHHRDDPFQIEAIFFGQAGMLSPEALPPRHREAALADEYFQKLSAEYRYLAHKFSMKPMNFELWRYLRLRPQNFPGIRLSQLASLYCSRRAGLRNLMECETIEQAQQMLVTQVSDYWQTHYAFGAPSPKNTKRLSAASLDLVMVNTIVPMLFAYGRHTRKEELCDRAFHFLEQLKPERNHVVSMWCKCGMTVADAGDSQALIQLKSQYCDRKDCLRCRIGYEFIASNHKNPAVALLSERGELKS